MNRAQLVAAALLALGAPGCASAPPADEAEAVDESAVVPCRGVLAGDEMLAVEQALEGARNECITGERTIESDYQKQDLLDACPYFVKLMLSEAGVVTGVVGSFRYTRDPKLVDCVGQKLKGRSFGNRSGVRCEAVTACMNDRGGR